MNLRPFLWRASAALVVLIASTCGVAYYNTVYRWRAYTRVGEAECCALARTGLSSNTLASAGRSPAA